MRLSPVRTLKSIACSSSPGGNIPTWLVMMRPKPLLTPVMSQFL
jgi:hypothetical protein